jgi:hypothetical protein
LKLDEFILKNIKNESISEENNADNEFNNDIFIINNSIFAKD